MMQVKDPHPGESGKVGFRQEPQNSCSSGFFSSPEQDPTCGGFAEAPVQKSREGAAGGKGRSWEGCSLRVGRTEENWGGEAGFGEGQSAGARSLCPTQVVV